MLATIFMSVDSGVNGKVWVGRANHVVVEVEFDLVGLFGGECSSVVERTNETTPA